MKTSYQVGEKVTCSENFVNAVGCYFAKGTTFTVLLGGETGGRSILLQADTPCMSRVWISDGLFLTDDVATAAWRARVEGHRASMRKAVR